MLHPGCECSVSWCPLWLCVSLIIIQNFHRSIGELRNGPAFSPQILAVKLLNRAAKGTCEMNRGVFVGLDVDRGTLQAAVRPAGQKWFANTSDSGISEIAN